MTALVWDKLEERFFEQGVDHGVLYEGVAGTYVNGVAWNGLTAVNAAPSGAEPNKQYADNIVYVTLMSVEEFSATIEAFMAPPEFDQYNGIAKTASGMKVGQQARGQFGFYWRSIKGNAVNEDLGFIHHLAYGCQASPSEKNNATKNDTPELATFSWSLSTTPVEFPGGRPTALVEIDSTDPDVDAGNLADLLTILHGSPGNAPRLPLPAEVDSILNAGILLSTPVEPAFDGVDDITIPTVAGVQYFIGGVLQTPGVKTITVDTIVTAKPAAGYRFTGTFVDAWLYEIP